MELLNVIFAAVVPSGFFAPHMMLQRDRPIPVWGTAGAGETVEVSFAGHRATAVVDAQGDWCAMLPATGASSVGRDLMIGDKVIGDVIVGDVYLCSGQSNMQFPLYGKSARQHDMKGNALVQIANDPSLRFTSPRRTYASAPTNDVELQWPDGRWQKATIHNFKDVWVWYMKRNVQNGTFAGNRIELSVYGLGKPQAVRYLHNSPWQGSVFNQASLPLGAFERKVEQ